MRRQLVPALIMFLALTVLTGVGYPLVVTAIAQVFPSKADGSLVEVDGKVVGSSLLGQNFTKPEYFQPRPSAAGKDGYDATASAGSNLGPTDQDLVDAVAKRVTDYRALNGLAADVRVPSDAVTASGSGLDPHISIANARLQAPRVARARQLDEARVRELIDANVDARSLGALGDPGVNVLELNLALDRS